jgi:hypothetical protein
MKGKVFLIFHSFAILFNEHAHLFDLISFFRISSF